MKTLILISLIFLISCSGKNQTDSVFIPYLQELGVEINNLVIDDLEKYPRKRDLLLRPAQERLSFVDMFKLPCALGDLVAERNSALGKVMPESRVFIYEWNFIKQTRDCLENRAIGDEDIRNQLKQILKSKSANLRSHFWNATFAGPEFNNFFSTSGNYNPKVNSEFLKDALSYFNYVLSTKNDSLNGKFFEAQLEQLRKNPSAYAFLNDLQRTTVYLNSVSGFLNTSSKNSDLLVVFQNHYPQKVQPYISGLHQTADKFLGQFNQLYQQQKDIAPASVKSYFNHI